MKKQVLLFAVVMSITTIAFSQTKRIALYGHSGPDAEFTTDCDDNYGLGPDYRINYRKTSGDTVNLTQKEKSNTTTTPAPKADSSATKSSPKPNSKKKSKQNNSQK